MTLPAPKLDDRRFQDLVDEAKLRVQHHCDLHGWTDHNVSDPGVMLIETFAWMTDQLLYRLNRVPDLNYVKFLELLGVTLLPPTAAITDLTFWLSKAQPEDKLVIPAGTQVSSARSGTGEQITFATTAALPIVPCSLELLKSVDHSGRDVKVRRNEDGNIRCFSDPPLPGDALLVGLSGAIPSCAVKLHLSCVPGAGGGISPDKAPLAWDASVGDDKGTVHLWNTRTRELIGRFMDHGVHAVRSVALSPVGHMLASGGDDGMIWLRDVREQEKPGRRLDGHGAQPVRSVAFSADGHMLASGGDDGTVRLWKARTGEELDSLTGHEGPVCGVAFSPDGHLLASCGDDGRVRLHRNARTIIGGYSFTVREADAMITVEVSDPEGADPDVFALTVVQHGKVVRTYDFSTRKDETNVVTNVNDDSSPIQIEEFGDTRERPKAGSYTLPTWPWGNSNSHMLTAHSFTLTLGAYELSSLNPGTEITIEVSVPEGADADVFSLTVSDGNVVKRYDSVSTRNDETNVVKKVNADPSLIKIEEVGDTREPPKAGSYEIPAGSVYGVAFSSDGQTLASAGADGTVRFWDARKGEELEALSGHDGPVRCVAFSPGGDTLASGGDDGTVRLYRKNARTIIGGYSFSLREPDAMITIEVSEPKDADPDVFALKVVQDGKVVKTYDSLTTRKDETNVVTNVNDDSSPIQIEEFGDTHERPKAGSYTLPAWQRLRALNGRQVGTVHGVAFRDGQTLATVGGDWTARLWNVEAGEQLQGPLSDSCPVHGLAFDANGETLATAGLDGGWEPCEVESDTTKGLNETADVTLHVPKTHEDVKVGEETAGWLRCRVRANAKDQKPYDQSPEIEGTCTAETIGGTVSAANAEIVEGELLGVSEGVAGQRFLLDQRPVVPMLWGEERVLEVSVSRGGDSEEWSEVSSFADSPKGARHFMFDPVSGEVVLGPAVRVKSVPAKIRVGIHAKDPLFRAGVDAELQRYADVRVVSGWDEVDVALIVEDRLTEEEVRTIYEKRWPKRPRAGEYLLGTHNGVASALALGAYRFTALEAGVTIQVFDPPPGSDPDDFSLTVFDGNVVKRYDSVSTRKDETNVVQKVNDDSTLIKIEEVGDVPVGSDAVRFPAGRVVLVASRIDPVLRKAVSDGNCEWVRRGDATGQAIFTAVRAAAREARAGTDSSAEAWAIRQYGAVPPKGAELRLRKYLTGGGERGNVSARELIVLRSPIANVASVLNRRRAGGGVDGEDIENAKLRGPITLRTGDRAVTPEDYEQLAREAAPELARVECIPATSTAEDPEQPDDEYAGVSRVLVIPTVESDRGVIRFEQLAPGVDLINRIKGYLDQRRVIGVRIRVAPPEYRCITIAAKLRSRPEFDRKDVQLRALETLYNAFSPVSGGRNGNGWEFGRDVLEGDVYAVLQSVHGVDRVEDCQLFEANPVTGVRTRPLSVQNSNGQPGKIKVPVSQYATVFSYRHYVLVEKR